MTEDLRNAHNPYGEAKLMSKGPDLYQQLTKLELIGSLFNAAGASEKFGEHHRIGPTSSELLQVALGQNRSAIFWTDYQTPEARASAITPHPGLAQAQCTDCSGQDRLLQSGQRRRLFLRRSLACESTAKKFHVKNRVARDPPRLVRPPKGIHDWAGSQNFRSWKTWPLLGLAQKTPDASG